ncbi:MAG: class II fructose-bisphosphate aldolase family protein [Candidatus Andersenbacteria bacterium]|nr:class II fructose-bisphosphate aldolase family protein [Candidatus Andersenbacteria bacterium]
MLVRPHELIKGALAGEYALGSFNTSNLEVTLAIVAAAQQAAAPVIVQTSEGAIKYAGLRPLTALIRAVAQQAAVPVVLHLDHGRNRQLIQDCIAAGFTSVMIDASDAALEENIGTVQQVVNYAHDRGVWVEAELGTMMGIEGAQAWRGRRVPEAFLTDPKAAKRFAAETGIDALAVSVGTIHGAFTGQEYIRFELLERIAAAVPHLPLVLHGASGVADDHLQRVAKTNVCKINVDTELRTAFEQAVRAYVNEAHKVADPREMLGPAREAVQAVVEKKLRVFGSAGQAKV